MSYDKSDIQAVARVCHEVNRAYCQSIGDFSQVPWEEAPEWQRDSAMKGVLFVISTPYAQPGDSHRSWLAEKERTGWKYGPVKDPEKKEHPCMVPFEDLPVADRIKDHLFIGACRAAFRILY